MEDYKSKVRKFIVDDFLFGDSEGLKDTTSLIDEGIMDSTGVFELIEFLSQEFGVVVDEEELLPENLDTIENVAAYLKMKLEDVKDPAVGGLS